MPDIALRLLVRVALCAALFVALHRVVGHWGVALLLGAAAAGALLARPVLELAGNAPGALFGLAWRDRLGRHYAWRGIPLDIHEDGRHVRWVCIADARRCVPGLPEAAVLRRLEPAGCGTAGPPTPEGRIASEALARVLARSADPETQRFLRWLDRDVTRPAQVRRAMAGGGTRPETL